MIPHIYMCIRGSMSTLGMFFVSNLISACLHGPVHTYPIFPVLWVLIIKYLNVIVFFLSL